MDLGKKLSEIRKAAGLSQVQLAEQLNKKGFNVKKYTISKWEYGTSNPSVEMFLAVCDICRVNNIRRTFLEKRMLRLYDIPVSAGHGDYLENSDYEMIEADELVPENADYAVRVNGNSMAPYFKDKQIIYIHSMPVINEGEIGIFLLNGNAYLKKLGQGCLISLNTDYKPIPIKEEDSFRVFGKVIG